MPKPVKVCFKSCCAALALLPAAAGAQAAPGPSITSAPLSAFSVPVDSPTALGLLSVVLALAGWWFLRRGHDSRWVVPMVLLAGLAGVIGQGRGLMAQVIASFTNPAGETLPISISPITTVAGIAGFEPADFTNGAGAPLRITQWVPPTFAQCFPGGSVSMLLAPGPISPSPYPACSVDLTLANADTCRVDVETLCRDLAAANTAILSATPTLQFVVNENGDVTVTNSAASPVAAENVAAVIPGASSISVLSSTCPASLAVGASCTITLTSLIEEGPTTIAISGTNTSSATTGVTVVPPPSTLTSVSPSSGAASGQTGVVLTGTGLTGATSVTFDGVPATSVNVVSSTTVTAVTPAHAPGAVDVVIATPLGGATLTNGYTYLPTAVGQPAGGGIIAVLNGGLNNLIAATADNSSAIEWGGFGTAVGAGAQSNTDGAANTAAIVVALGNNGGTPYAAQVCGDYEVDSQGNTPCQAGNTCYSDWFLPAGNNSTASGQLNGLFTNRAAVGGFAAASYWSSTEFSGNPTGSAWSQDLAGGAQSGVTKNVNLRVRCVRAFTP